MSDLDANFDNQLARVLPRSCHHCIMQSCFSFRSSLGVVRSHRLVCVFAYPITSDIILNKYWHRLRLVFVVNANQINSMALFNLQHSTPPKCLHR